MISKLKRSVDLWELSGEWSPCACDGESLEVVWRSCLIV